MKRPLPMTREQILDYLRQESEWLERSEWPSETFALHQVREFIKILLKSEGA